MKNIFWTLCFAVITHHAAGNIQGSPISSLSPRLLSARATTIMSTGQSVAIAAHFGYNCKNVSLANHSNETLSQTCLGGSTPFKTQICEKTYPGQPYCDDGGCSPAPDPNDKQCSRSGITCTGTGYFPNPLNCSQFYFCEGKQGASKFYECPSGFVYNSQTQQCKRRILASECRTVKCDSNPDQYVAYPADPSLYALCLITENPATPIVFKCLGSEQFVASQHRCVFQCKKEGRVADGRDCMKYYECYRNGLNYIMLHEICMAGFIFSSEENGCVVGTCAAAADEGSGTGDITG